jgi:cyclase
MNRVRIIPILLLKHGGLYKTVKYKKPIYIGDPINTVKIFNEKQVDELIVLGFNVSIDKIQIEFKKLKEIAGEAFMPMSYGGGIQSFEDAKMIFDAGYEKVILNSILFSKIGIVQKIANVYGAQAVVGSIDVKKNIFGNYKVYSHSGTKKTNYTPVDWARILEENGIGEIIVNVIDRDGTWYGYDEIIINQIADSVTVPVIASCGAGNIDDFNKAVSAGASAVAAGSMFVYQKKGMGVLISFPTGYKLLKI